MSEYGLSFKLEIDKCCDVRVIFPMSCKCLQFAVM